MQCDTCHVRYMQVIGVNNDLCMSEYDANTVHWLCH